MLRAGRHLGAHGQAERVRQGGARLVFHIVGGQPAGEQQPAPAANEFGNTPLHIAVQMLRRRQHQDRGGVGQAVLQGEVGACVEQPVADFWLFVAAHENHFFT